MNNQDRDGLEELKTILENQSRIQNKQSEILSQIHRAIYGDPDNQVSGMMTSQKIMDERIHELEENVKSVTAFKKKFIYYGSIIIAVVGYGINKLIDFLIKVMP